MSLFPFGSASQVTLANPSLDVKPVAPTAVRARWWPWIQPLQRRKRRETESLLYFSFPHERKITAKQEIESKNHGTANGCPCRASHTLRTLHHLWLPGPRPTGRSDRAGSRKPERKNRSPGARALTVPYRRRFHFTAV